MEHEGVPEAHNDDLDEDEQKAQALKNGEEEEDRIVQRGPVFVQ